MGLGQHAPLELQKVLAGKSASVGIALGQYAEIVSGSASSSDIDTMLQLVHLKFTDARQDEPLFQSFLARQREQARNALAQPDVVFSDTIAATLYGGHPRVARVMRPEDFSGITRQRSAQIYQQRFSSAKDLTFVLVGSFDMSAIKPLLATYLASLPTPDIPVGFQDRGVRPVKGVIKKEVFSGTEPKSSISIHFTGKAEYSEAERLRFHAMLEIINLRITEVLREKMALIYGGGMNGDITPFPYPHYNIKVGLPTGPDKVERAIAATFAEIDQLKSEGPSIADLNKVKQTWLQAHKRALRENGYWLSQIQNALMHGTDPAKMLQYPEQVEAITPAELQSAARRYFQMDNYVQVILSPEN
jgi:zinc protease